MKLVNVQLCTGKTKAETFRRVEESLDQANIWDADVIILPEMFACPYENAQFPRYAEESGGETWQFCRRLAQKTGAYLVAGTMPELDGERIYNTAYVFDRRGQELLKYRKMHLFDIDIEGGQRFRESDTLSPGDTLGIFDTEFGKMGLCICYDLRFPELSRLLVDAGAQVIFCPAAFNTTTGPLHWELLFRQRAVDNQVFTVGASPARNPQASYQAYGHSVVADPWGRVLMEMEEKEELRATTIDLALVGQVREQLPLLAHRKGELYRKLEQ